MNSVDRGFMKNASINQWRDYAHSVAREHGWWDKEDFNVGEKLMLVTTELAEAMEDYRTGKMDLYLDEKGKPCGFPSELADAVIRILDLCGRMDIDLADAMVTKSFYNESRPYRHGGKRA